MARRVRTLLALLVAAVAVVAVVVLATGEDDRPRPTGASDAPRAAAPPPVRLEGWRHRADPEDRGLEADWPRRPPTMRPVAVPGAAEPRVVGGEAGRRTFAGSVGWWRAALVVPGPGRYAVRFGSVGHRATVWIDGRRACGHTGAYAPFECRVDLPRGGRHSVMLRADWRDLERQAAEGHDRAWWNWGGPSWAVTARRLADAEPSVVAVTTRLRPGGAARVVLSVRVEDTRRDGAPATRPVVARLRHRGATLVARTPRPVRLAPGASRRVRLVLDVPDAALWSPDAPTLHEVAVRVGGPDGGATRRRIGLREIGRDGPRLLLNGTPLRFVGAGLPPDARGHGDAFTAADRAEVIDHLRAIGANAVRSQHPLSDEMLADLDAAGILVWQLVGPFDKAGRFWADTPARRREARRRVLATVDRQAAHPSVLAWSLSNEAAGRGQEGQGAWTASVARTLRRRTPGILAAIDVWGRAVPREPTLLLRDVDAVGLTEYVGMAELAEAPLTEQEALVAERLDRLRVAAPGALVVVTEFGANANASNPSDRVGGFGYQADLLTRRTAFYAARPDVAGMLVWTLRDYAVSADFGGGALRGRIPGLRLSGPLSEKGLFRYDGTPKPSVAAVRAAFARVRG